MITTNVDTTNPGQFLACCGLFELAHRLWDGTEGWFDKANGKTVFCLQNAKLEIQALGLLQALTSCSIMKLSSAENGKLAISEATKMLDLENQINTFDVLETDDDNEEEEEEEREDQELYFGTPFSMRLDWWCDNSNRNNENKNFKVWSGKQKIDEIVTLSQNALKDIYGIEDFLNKNIQLRKFEQNQKIAMKGGKKPKEKKISASYFDARCYTHKRDVGYSLDKQTIKVVTYPAVELLALIGVQRFQPVTYKKQCFMYATWTSPMPIAVAAAIACGMTSSRDSCIHEFYLQAREDSGKYKSFSYSKIKGK